MTQTPTTGPDIQAGRLAPADYAQRFADAGAPFTAQQAVLEAERCLYCYDAPCATACPTGIDVPSFIHRISQGNVRGAAQAILSANPLGGMCARVCPTEELCEAVCVRNTQQGVPVAIGKLQRHAVDAVMHLPQTSLFQRAPATGKKVAVVGAGPAGLACAHGLALKGHEVTVFDAHAKAGGLNEYGLATYKTADDFAQREIDWLLGIGGIRVQTGWKLDSAAQLEALRAEHDAVFLGIGLGAVNQPALPGSELNGIRDAVDFIAELRQCEDLSTLPVGRRVVVIGGGMTAVDASVQSRLLGASEVHMVYRRGPEAMGASVDEQTWAKTNGVVIEHWLAPVAFEGEAGAVRAVRFERQRLVDGRLVGTGEFETRAADTVLQAVGQRLASAPWLDSLRLAGGRIAVDALGRTSLAGVWAGGDCVGGGRDLTVEAVEDGKQAALAIHASFSSSNA
ncbi:NAD(P)-dependent oxidoreductase [Curvibacter sp. HBC61]|uniref:NAD(P)-dependent oxidoreductase n=1 Tax=Curvibacter cyanobacteriorum TaxID=3026422 RepID=A0ABT5MZ61_9BURK|nr:NAD(P)-dependent oxidoreductase [Curvibacter sp. HBC61]MDD0839324.1 NAD(P)-dependent oxidoreductase [Curvibacter sp. HBC61]